MLSNPLLLLFKKNEDPIVQLSIAVVVILLAVVIAAVSKANRDPNKWYGKMLCLKCDYRWQSRRQTPPARCARCSSTSISIEKG